MMKRAFAFALLLAAALASRAEEPLRVGIAGQPPFLIDKGNGVWEGACIDIWEKVAAARQWKYSYTFFPTVHDGILGVKAGKVDALVANAGITKERLNAVEFTQPYLRSGLQIMVAEPRPHSITRLAMELLGIAALPIFWALLVAVCGLTCVVYVFEKRHNPDFPKKRGEGIVEAFYYVITLALTGKSAYKGFPGILGRLVMVGGMLLGMITVAYLTSTITTSMTVEKLQGKISGPQDLPGKTVGALAGGTAEDYLRNSGITTISYPDMDAAVQALLGHQVEAIVGSFPVLQSYDFNHPNLPITEVGPVFSPQNFGFALPIGSPLRMPINETLLELSEKGVLSEIFRHCLGPVYQP